MPAPHILLVEDDPAIRSLFERMIRRLFPAVALTTIGNGVDALLACRRQTVDILIADISLPGLDGLSLVRRLRNQGVTLPILIISAAPEREDEALDAGATAFLPKPLPLCIFQQALAGLLELECALCC